jgi:phosphoribosylanthranilate isomerase
MKFWDKNDRQIRVKICNIKNLEVGAIISELNPDALGFHLFDNENFKDKANAHKKSLTYLNPIISKWLLTDIKSKEQLNFIITQLKIDVLQLQRNYTPDEVINIRNLINSHSKKIRIAKSFSTKGKTYDDLYLECASFESICDAFLLDSTDTGGSGEFNNLHLCSQIVSSFNIPILLAGGLNSKNVKIAIKEVNPFGVDVETGIEEIIGYDSSLGKNVKVKSYHKARSFIDAVKS